MIYVWNSFYRLAFRYISKEMKNTQAQETNATYSNAYKISKRLLHFLHT